MAVTPPPSITPAPTPAPQRNDRTTFSGRVDAFITWITTAVSQFAALATNVQNNATDAATSATTATTQAATATGAATSATSTANATAWVSGTTYAQNLSTISQINFLTYRRKSAGAGTTDPKNDPTNWAPVGSLNATPTSAQSQTSAADITLTSGSAGMQTINMTAMGKSVNLPDATTMTSVGGQVFVIRNSGGYPFGIRDNAGTLIMGVAAGGLAYVTLEDKSTAAGIWSVTGTNLEPGLITVDSTFSSTYTSTVSAPFVALDNNTSIHFARIASGFAAFVVDNTGKVLTTPVTVTAANIGPSTAFKINSTQAIVFYEVGGTASAAVLSVSGSSPSLSLAVGTAPNAGAELPFGQEDFVGAPKIVQLSSSLYLSSYTNGTNTKVIAISVSGATVTIGTAANIITTSSVATSTTTYALTATTALVLYLTGASPYAVNAVVISVSGTTCTVGTPTTGGNVGTTAVPSSCLLSATKALFLIDNNTVTTAQIQAVTITGTSVSIGAALTVESGMGTAGNATNGYSGSLANRYNPHLFPLSANSALFWYLESGVSRAVVLTESAGAVTAGVILYRSISYSVTNGDGGGAIFPQGATEFLALKQEGAIPFRFRAVSNKISGTAITAGQSNYLDAVSNSNTPTAEGLGAIRLSSGDYVVTFSANGSVDYLPVLRSNGDAINYRGGIKIPTLVASATMNGAQPAAFSNRLVLLGYTVWLGQTAGATTYQLRLLNVEIAA